MPDKYFESIPKFSGNCAITIEDHIDVVWSHMEAYGAEEKDVYMRGLLFSLEGEAYRWFYRFPALSIGGCDAFVTILKGQWSTKLDDRFLLNQLFEIRKKENETIQEFILRFVNIVASVPDTIKPKDQALLIHYLNAFDEWLGYHLKEKNPADLKHTQDNARKAKANVVSMDKQNFFESYGPSSSKIES